MSFRNADSWLRELARSGLPPPAQKTFLATLSSTIDNRSRYFPADPVIFVERVRTFILHAFLSQMGPPPVIRGSGLSTREDFEEPMLEPGFS